MVYLDYNATTPVDARVLDAMMPAFADKFGNPSSTTHGTGAAAAGMVEEARRQVASAIGMATPDVVFTSGATEANAMAIACAKGGRILYGATEHKSVIEQCRFLDGKGTESVAVPVGPEGSVDPGLLDSMLKCDARMVSIMAANSETGVVNPVEEIAEVAHRHGAVFHCDATQAVGKIPFDAGACGIDMVTLSSHKIYGPKGCGAIVASRNVRKQMAPLLRGGGQERGLRSGTLNVPGIVGFGAACILAASEGLADASRQEYLRDRLEDGIASSVPGTAVNGEGARRLPNTSSVRIKGALASAVIVNMPNVEISTGSACSSSTMEPSHVLTAMGLDRTAADESIRVSIGRPTTEEDVDTALLELKAAVQFVRGKEEHMAEKVR